MQGVSKKKHKDMRNKNFYGFTSIFLALATFGLTLAGCSDPTTPPTSTVPAATAIAVPPTAYDTSTPIPASPTVRPTTQATFTPAGPTVTVEVPPTETPTDPTPAITPDTGVASQILDLNFISNTQGWALVSTCAGSDCRVVLKMTTDGGQTWQARSAPSVGPDFYLFTIQDHNQVARVYFANSQDGWLFGPGFYSTHDGGATWQKGNFTEDIIELTSAKNEVLAVTRTCPQSSDTNGCNYGLISSTDNGRNWQKQANFPAIPGPEAQLVPLNEQDFWLISTGTPIPTNDIPATVPTLAVTHDGGKSWQIQANPCNKKGWVEARLAAANPQNLYLLCATTPATIQQPKYLYHSGDGGQSWKEIGNMAGAISGHLSSFAVSAPGKLWLANNRYTLLTSGDNGLNWEWAIPLEETNPGDGGIGPVTFADATHGWLAAEQGRIFYTTDGGANWQPVVLN